MQVRNLDTGEVLHMSEIDDRVSLGTQPQSLRPLARPPVSRGWIFSVLGLDPVTVRCLFPPLRISLLTYLCVLVTTARAQPPPSYAALPPSTANVATTNAQVYTHVLRRSIQTPRVPSSKRTHNRAESPHQILWPPPSCAGAISECPPAPDAKLYDVIPTSRFLHSSPPTRSSHYPPY